MDQAALQWVSLEQSSGAPCRTAWGAREQQKSACMVRSLADENRWLCNLPTLRVSGPCFGWHCWLLLRILQCTAGLSGTMTPWNVLNSSAIAPFNEPCKKSEDGVTSQLRRSLIVCCMISLSKCGVIILYGSMHFACLLISLAWFPSIWALPTAADYHRQRSIIWSGVHIFPYETRGPALCFLWRLYGWFSPGLQIFLNANTVCPPLLGGYLVQWPLRHYYQQRMDDLCPLHCGLMHKYIWEDAERGNFRRPVTMYRFFLCQRSYAQCFDFYVSQNVVVDN